LVLVQLGKQSRLPAHQGFAGFSSDLGVCFQTAVATNVEHGVAALGEHAADEQAAVTVGGIFLAAEQGHAEALHAGFKPLDRCQKTSVAAQPAVENAAFGVVISRIVRPSAQFFAKIKVADSCLLQGTLYEFLVELRDIA